MAQKIFYSWEDEDSTFDLSRWRNGLVPNGVYHGFDADYDVMNLLLEHSNGVQETKQDLNLSDPFGLIVTKQGCLVREDEEIELPISQTTTNPRIDAIYLDHEYVEITGGSPATYAVVEGTPAATPAPPSLPSPNRQVLIGYLYIPAGCSNLGTTSGVVFTKVDAPSFGNNPNVMYLNRTQISTMRKQFYSLAGRFVTGEAHIADAAIKVDEDTNYVYLPNVQSEVIEIEKLIWTDLNTTPITRGAGQPIYILTDQALRLKTGTFISGGEDKEIKAGEVFALVEITGVGGASNPKWIVWQGAEVNRATINKLKKALSFNKGEYGDAGGNKIDSNAVLQLAKDGNFIQIENASKVLVKAISSFKEGHLAGATDEAGTVIALMFDETTTIEHLTAYSNPSDTKKIYCPNEANIVVTAGQIVLLVEDTEHWKFLSSNLNLSQLNDVLISVGLAAGDVLYFNGTKWVNTPVLNIIRNTMHAFTKLQTWKGQTACQTDFVTDPSNPAILITESGGNHYVLDLTNGGGATGAFDGVVFADIKLKKDDNSIVTVPTGTLITIKFLVGNIPTIGPTPALGVNFIATYIESGETFADTPRQIYKDAVVGNGYIKYPKHGDYMVLMKAASGWIILSSMAEIKRQLEYYTKVEAAKTVGTGGVNFAANRTHAGTGWAFPLKYRKTNRGRVQLSGGYRNQDGTGGLIFTLPSGYAPPNDVYIPCINTSTGDVHQIVIYPSGEVHGYLNMSVNVDIMLDPVSFYISDAQL